MRSKSCKKLFSRTAKKVHRKNGLQPMRGDLHPTTKPLELAEKEVANSSRPDEIVFDGFLGSGTTLIACERLGRRCRAVEISPGYVAVTLQRWADMTGETPTLLNPCVFAKE